MSRTAVVAAIAMLMALLASSPAQAATVVVDGIRIVHRSNGDVVITGTNAADPPIFIINGADQALDTAVALHGMDPSNIVFNGVVGNVTVNLKGGDDYVEVNNERLQGNLTINAGNGADYINLHVATVSGAANLRTGSGTASLEDQISIRHSAFERHLNVRGGAGGQQMSIGQSTVAQRLSVLTGAGPSNTQIISMETGSFSYTGGNDNDVFIAFGDNTLGPSPRVRTLGGADRVGVHDLHYDGTLLIRTGSGPDDIIDLDGEDSGEHRFDLHTGNQNDTVTVRGAWDPSSRANGGAGRDSLADRVGIDHVNFEIFPSESDLR